MEQAGASFTIGAFAAAAGVNVETVRYYQRQGLLREPQKPQGGIRRYETADVARVRFIKTAQQLGFSLGEVGALLTLDSGMQCGRAQALAESKLKAVRTKLADLRRIERVLKAMVRECESARGKVSCPMVDALHGKARQLAAGRRAASQPPQ